MHPSLDLAQPVNRRSDEWWRRAVRELWTLWLSRPTLTKRAVLMAVWTYTPRKVKLAVGGVAALAVALMAGALAVIVLAVEALLR
jgi:hypothetical protein